MKATSTPGSTKSRQKSKQCKAEAGGENFRLFFMLDITRKIFECMIAPMNVGMIIGIVLSLLSIFGALIGFLIRICVLLGRALQRIDYMEKRTAEEREHNREKFSQLFEFKNSTESNIAIITVNTQQIMETLKEIKEERR